MTCTLGIVTNQETKKAVGVVLHDEGAGRVVLKTRPSDASLLRLFGFWVNKSVIEQVREQIKGRKFTRRIRVIPTEMAYVKLLCDRFIKLPYAVEHYSRVQCDHLDSALDKFYQDLVDHAPVKTIAPTSYANPFKTT